MANSCSNGLPQQKKMLFPIEFILNWYTYCRSLTVNCTMRWWITCWYSWKYDFLVFSHMFAYGQFMFKWPTSTKKMLFPIEFILNWYTYCRCLTVKCTMRWWITCWYSWKYDFLVFSHMFAYGQFMFKWPTSTKKMLFPIEFILNWYTNCRSLSVNCTMRWWITCWYSWKYDFLVFSHMFAYGQFLFKWPTSTKKMNNFRLSSYWIDIRIFRTLHICSNMAQCAGE